MVAAAATAAWASAVGIYDSVQKRRSTSSKIVVPSEPSGLCSKTTYTPRSQARPSMRRGSMRRCSSSKPSRSAPLSDGVTARCAARLASQVNTPFANCVRAASTVKTLSGRKGHCKTVPAWASVTLSVRSAKAGIPAGPARHCATPGGIGTSGSMVGFTVDCALLFAPICLRYAGDGAPLHSSSARLVVFYTPFFSGGNNQPARAVGVRGCLPPKCTPASYAGRAAGARALAPARVSIGRPPNMFH